MNREMNSALEPMQAWLSIYDANVDLWSQRMAELMNTEVFTRAFGMYLDSYLATSAPFRKLTEQYVDFWLASLSLPGREEWVQATQQMAQTSLFLDTMKAQTTQMADQLRTQMQRVEALSSAPDDGRVEMMETEMRTLNDHMSEMTQSLMALMPQVEAVAATQRASDERMQVFNTRMEEMLSALQAQPQEAAMMGSAVAEQMQMLDGKAEQLLHMVRNLQTPNNP